MLFNRNDDKPNERILYKTKPNIFLGCKKAIYGAVLLVIVLFVSPMIIKAIGKMQVYLISQIKLPLTRYAAIAVFVIILILILYIIWQLIGWYSLEYTLTDTRIIIKSGVLSTKKSYMPYSTIQDVNSSQNLIARLFNVGSVSVFSAYDNNLMELKNISNPSKAEEIIFSNMVNFRNFQPQPMQFNPNYPQNHRANYLDDDEYLGRNEFYDEFEPITPITHENNVPRRDYEYYPENLRMDDDYQQRPTYDYEPYEDFNSRRPYSNENHYDRVRDDYSYGGNDYYENNEPQFNYNEDESQVSNIDSSNVDESSENAIKRHFDKFKK